MFDGLYLARGLRRAVSPLVWLALLAYLGYHAFVGERGIYTHLRLEREVATFTARLEELRDERERLEQRVSLLTGPEIDADMLDERTREILNFADPNEITILRNGN